MNHTFLCSLLLYFLTIFQNWNPFWAIFTYSDKIFEEICMVNFYFDILKWPTCWKGRHSYQKNVNTNFSVFWHFWEMFVIFCFNSTKNEKLFLINGIENQQICNFHRFRKSDQNNWILFEIIQNNRKISEIINVIDTEGYGLFLLVKNHVTI